MLRMPYFVYLLRCADQSLYCGFTTDISKRLTMHAQGKASKYTRVRLPVKLVYHEEFSLRTRALKREYEIKQLSRAEKIELVRVSAKQKKN